MDTSVYRQRRSRVLDEMGEGVMVIATAPEVARNRDTHYPYRHDSYFYWLSGFNEPEAVVVLVGGKEPRHILFCREKNEEREIWDGFRYGPEAAREAFGFDEAFAYDRLDFEIPKLLENQPQLSYVIGRDQVWDNQIMIWLSAVRHKTRSGIHAPSRFIDARIWLDEMRLVKDAHELALMRRAAEISAGAHRAAMRATRPGCHEYEIEAELLSAFRRGGAEAPAYTSIVASGANACVLHYVENDKLLNDHTLVLIDAGCEVEGYAADITRTFPVNGRFNAAQKEVYEIVLAAQQAAFAAIAPGRHFMEPHDAAVRVLTRGLVDLKLLAGDVDAPIERAAYRRFYMHGTGHWLGLDVHDAGSYKTGGQWTTLRPGMTLTVEPGLYIRPAADVPEALAGIGIRIEDDVRVVEGGCDVYTTAPKTVADIEEVMRHD
jgi:Xaa-Pro aminopeptidase